MGFGHHRQPTLPHTVDTFQSCACNLCNAQNKVSKSFPPTCLKIWCLCKNWYGKEKKLAYLLNQCCFVPPKVHNCLDRNPYLLLIDYDYHDWNEWDEANGDVALQLSLFDNKTFCQVTLVGKRSNKNKLSVKIRCLLQEIFRRRLETYFWWCRNTGCKPLKLDRHNGSTEHAGTLLRCKRGD